MSVYLPLCSLHLAVGLEGDRSGDGGLSPETCEANHCQSAILDFDGAAPGKLFRSLLGGEAKGIVKSGDHVLWGKDKSVAKKDGM